MRFRQSAALLTAVIFVLSGCAAATPPTPPGSPSPASTSTPGEPTEAPITAAPTGPTGSITVAVPEWGGQQFDPGVESLPGLPYFGAMYDGIIGIDDNGSPSGASGAVEDWAISPDGLEVRLTLRQGMLFHDGTEATAEDLAFSLQRFAAADAPTSSKLVLRSVTNFDVVDKYTVRLTLERADASFIPGLSLSEGDALLLKADAYRSTGEGWELSEPDNPIGTGPFRFASRSLGEYVEYEAFDGYWDQSRAARVATVRIVLIADPTTRLSALRAGEVDMAPLNPEQVQGARDAGLQVMGPTGGAITLLSFYGSYDSRFLTSKTEFRKALIRGYDKEAIVERFYDAEVGTMGTGTPLFSPVSLGWDPDLPEYGYDPEEARDLLESAGYDGRPVKVWSFPFGTAPENPQILEAIVGYWQGIGLNVELTPTDWPTFRQNLFAQPQQLDGSYAAHVGIQVPISGPSVLISMSSFMVSQECAGVIVSYWKPDEACNMRNELGQISDPDQLDDALRDLNHALYDEYWADQIVYRNLPFGVSSQICDWNPKNGTSRHWELSTVQLCQ